MVSFQEKNIINNKSKLARLLLYIARGLGLDEISERLKVDRNELGVMMAALLAEGYVREANPGEQCPCNTCPLRKICGGRTFTSNNSKVYILTQKGLRTLTRLIKKGYHIKS